MNSEPKYLAYEGSSVATCFLLLNSFLFSSCSTVDWPSSLFFLCQSHYSRPAALSTCSAHDSAKYVRCEGLRCPSHSQSDCHQNTSSRCRRVHVVSNILPGCDLKLTFLSVTDTYLRTHVHCENRSFIQSLALMCSAIRPTHAINRYMNQC